MLLASCWSRFMPCPLQQALFFHSGMTVAFLGGCRVLFWQQMVLKDVEAVSLCHSHILQ